jgi:Domain of unknown function (DUF4258)
MPHIYNHQVDEEEVEDVLSNPGIQYSGSDNSKIAVGQTRSGRYIRVIYKLDPEPDSVFVITAYGLIGKALKTYRRRKRRK